MITKSKGGIITIRWIMPYCSSSYKENDMSRLKGRRGNRIPVCFTCLISCVVSLVITVVGLIIAANVAFNKYVSPYIGGVSLSECNKLLKGIYRSDRDKIITDEYTAEDLDNFYYQLNSMLYQTEKDADELQAEYDSLSADKKTMTYEEYAATHKYRVTLDTLLGAVNLKDISKNNEEENVNSELAAADDGEDPLTSLFQQLHFDFTKLADYPYASEIEDYSYTSFEIEPNQVAALVGEMVPKILSMVDMPSEFANYDLTSYVKIPQIITSYTLPEGAENREKSLKLTMTVEFFVHSMVQKLVAPMLEEQGMNSAVIGLVKKLLPKKLYITAGVMPLDETQDAYLSINNYDEKQTENLKTIINALTKKFNFSMFPSEEEEIEGSEESTVQSKSLFLQLNEYVCTAFTKINDYAPLQFVPKGESATLRLAHIQALLSAMQLFDPDDLEHSVTPHMFLSTLRCLIDVSKDDESNAESLDALYAQLSAKYGIDASFWEDHTLFDTDTLSSLPSEIDLNDVEFKENSEMKIYLREGQMTSLLTSAVENGFFKNESGELAAAEDGEFNIMNILKFESFNIVKGEEGRITDYSYTDEDGVLHTLNEGNYTIYSVKARVALSIVDLLGGQNSSSEILSSLAKTLPENLRLALAVKVKDITDDNGILFNRIIGKEAAKTSFEINKFNEYYTEKVITVFKLMIEKLSGSSDFGMDSITEAIEEAISKVFSTIEDKLYVNLAFSDKDDQNLSVGCLVLPSIYELVRGFATNKINSDDSLTEEDNLSIEELKDIFVTLYNTDIAIVEHGAAAPDNADDYAKVLFKFNENSADVFLKDFSDKYYLKTSLTKDQIFGGSGLETLLSTDNINFKGYTNADDVYMVGIYKDAATALDTLRVTMNGDQLCALINSSDSLNLGDGNEFLKTLEMITCDKEWIDGKLYLDMEFKASVAVENNSDSFDPSSFIPSELFITARVLIYAEDYSATPRYSTEILINCKNTDKLAKLINIFTENTFDTSSITETVENSVGQAFDNIQENVNLVFKQSVDGIMQIDTIFNTINKRSHADDDAYNAKTSEEKHADDEKLKEELQEFGREPAYTTKNVSYESEENIYSPEDSDIFLDEVNLNYYIDSNNKLTTESIKNMDSINAEIIDFDNLYSDEREYGDGSAMRPKLTNNRFTALANNFFDNSFDVIIEGEGGEPDTKVGSASIAQTRIYENSLEMVIKFVMDFSGDNADKQDALPAYFFITTYTSLVEGEDYATEIIINSFVDADETEDLFARVKLMCDVFNIDFDINSDDIKKSISDKIKEIFDDYLVMFGEFKKEEGQIVIPNFFEYISGGKLDKDGEGKGFYNKDEKMYDDEEKTILTDPETLRYRLKEIGKKEGVFESDGHSMLSWYDHKPYDVYEGGDDHRKYLNDNVYLSTSESDFYSDMQAYYFLNDAVDSSTFNKSEDESDKGVLGNLTENLGKFNLYGDRTLSLENATDAVKYTYYGLYYYEGEQINPKMSDKALASIINTQNDTISGISSVDRVEITSVKITNASSGGINIEMTMKVYTDNAVVKYMPEYFYITSFTLRTINEYGIGYDYSTTLTLNRMETSDFTMLKRNLSHLGTFNIDSELNTESIGDQINQALSDLFDNKLKNYMESINEFSAAEKANGDGFGYIEFKNIYSVIVDKTLNEDEYQEDDDALDMQRMIVKLHKQYIDNADHTNDHKLFENLISDAERVQFETDIITLLNNFSNGTAPLTDKQLAYCLSQSEELKNKLDVLQGVIFTSTNAAYDNMESVLTDSLKDENFNGFAEGHSYVMFNVGIDLENISSNVAFLPEYIYGSVLFDENNVVLGTFFNDFTEEEQELFMKLVQDNNNTGDLNIEQKLKDSFDNFKTTQSSGSWSYNQSADFTLYFGYLQND